MVSDSIRLFSSKATTLKMYLDGMEKVRQFLHEIVKSKTNIFNTIIKTNVYKLNLQVSIFSSCPVRLMKTTCRQCTVNDTTMC